MLQIFGLTLAAGQPLDRVTTTELALRLRAAVTTFERQPRTPAAVAATVRADVLAYLAARRRGTLVLGAGAAACDTAARALLRLTVDAPPVVGAGATQLVA